MKHLFVVHSPITFLIAHAVIEHLQLSLGDVVVLSNGYSLPIDKYKSAPFFSNLNHSKFHKLKYMNAPFWEDRYLSAILDGEEFIAYIDLMSYHQRVFITHSRCKGFHFIEEGNASYRDNDTLDDLSWDRREQSFRLLSLSQRVKEVFKAAKWAFRGYSLRLLSLPYSYTNYSFCEEVKYFGFSELAFPSVSHSNKVTVPLKVSNEIALMAVNIQLSNCLVWIDGSGAAFTNLPDDVYHRAIDRGIEILYDELTSKPIHVKLRPGISDYSTNYLYNRLQENGFTVSVMPNNLIIECVFANSTNCTVVGNLSSSLFYASIFGHKSYSIYSLFEKKAPTVFDQMSGFWNNVKRL